MKPFCQPNSPADADLNEIVYQYNSCLHNILDNHAPLKSRTITIRPYNPWYSPEIDEAKKLWKPLERKWRKTKLEVDREIFTTQRQPVCNMIYEAKAAYYRNKYQTVLIKNNFLRLLKLFCTKKENPNFLHTILWNKWLKDLTSSLEKLQKFATILTLNPLLLIFKTFETEHKGTSCSETFTSASEKEIYKIISASPPKSCDSDPIPTWLLKKHLNLLARSITRVVNLSFKTAVFPSSFKSTLDKSLD